MDWYEDEVRHLEATLRDHPPSPRSVAFYGSSSIRLWDTLAADFPGQNVVNIGFGGSTLAACAHFFRRLVPPAGPRAVVLYAGDNDLGDGCSPEDVLASFKSLAGQLRSALPTTRLAFLAIKPSLARWHLEAAIESTNRLVAAEIATWRNARYVDLHHSMLGADGRPRPGLYAADGLHLSPAGYRAWAEIVGRERWIFSSLSPNLPLPYRDIGQG